MVEPAQAAEDDFVDHFRQVGIGTSSYYRNCTPGFITNEADVGQAGGFLGSCYGPGPSAFFDRLAT
jgi:hypothetical protein